MAYCTRCRIGTVGSDRLCVLCGASQEPETRRGKIAEASASVLASLLNPVGIAIALLVLTFGGIGAIARHTGQLPPGVLRAPNISALTPPDPAAAGPWGVVLFIIGPAILQSLALLLIVLLILFILRRRNTRRDHAAETY